MEFGFYQFFFQFGDITLCFGLFGTLRFDLTFQFPCDIGTIKLYRYIAHFNFATLRQHHADARLPVVGQGYEQVLRLLGKNPSGKQQILLLSAACQRHHQAKTRNNYGSGKFKHDDLPVLCHLA